MKFVISAILALATSSAMAVTQNKDNANNVIYLKNLVFNQAPSKTDVTLPGQNCKVELIATPVGLTLYVEPNKQSHVAVFYLSRSAKVSQQYGATNENGTFTATQVNNVETERGDDVMQESVTIKYSEPGKLSYVSITDINDSSKDPGEDAPIFDPANAYTLECNLN